MNVYYDDDNVNILLSKTLVSVDVDMNEDTITFVTSCGKKFVMFHDQECCEHVYIEDICGDINDLVGEPLVEAEEVSGYIGPDAEESYTWTFYKFRTVKGCVTIRWFGKSKGYYSESVNFMEVK